MLVSIAARLNLGGVGPQEDVQKTQWEVESLGEAGPREDGQKTQ